MTRWRRLLDRYVPLAPEGGFETTLDGKLWYEPFSWVVQLNGPSYTTPRPKGTLVVRVRYRRRFLGRVPLRARWCVIGVWFDGIDAAGWLLGGGPTL